MTTVTGTGPLVEVLERLDHDRLWVHVFAPEAEELPVVDHSVDSWVRDCEQPMLDALEAVEAARAALDGGGRLVFVVPTTGMSGAAGFAATAAAAEGIRALAKSCARQWGAHGIRVNVVAVRPAGEVDHALVEAPLGAIDPVDDLLPLFDALAGEDMHAVTGVTITADGGSWILP